MTGTIEIIGAIILAIALGWVSRFGQRKRITEARFDSETEKEIE